MKMSGEKTLALPQGEVWEALNDPEILRQSIPGCENFEALGDYRYRATVATKIGPIQTRFQGNVQLSDIDPPNGYTLSGEGSGGAAGSGKGSARIHLEPVPEGTYLTWDADAQVSGKLAQIGSRLIDSTAHMMANQFFDRFEQLLAGEKPQEQPVAISVFLPAWFRIAGWVALLIIIILIYILFI